MFERLSDRTAAVVFIVLTLTVSLTTVRIADGLVMAFSPLLVTLVMLLVVTCEGRSRQGWRRLGIGTLGLRTWPLALATTVGVNVLAIGGAVALGLARFSAPRESWWQDLLVLCVSGPILALGEEIGWRGYLQPRLQFLGQPLAMLTIGVVWIAWHLPYILLTPYYHAEGNRAVVLALFSLTVVAASFLFGHLREMSGSMWPAVIAHWMHNMSFAMIATYLISTDHPVAVNEYLAGDSGLFVAVGTALCSLGIGLSRSGRLLRSSGHRSAHASARG